MKFHQLPLDSNVQKIIQKRGFDDLTSIQEKCIPKILQRKDVVGQAETGSGKTLAFCLPIVQMIHPEERLQVLVLTPTRELCVQVTDVFTEFGKPLGITTCSVYGGVSIQPQINAIQRANVVVATPGRLLDHLNRKTISFADIQFLVLDETDKMLEMGFIEDVERIISQLPHHRQTLMFSATIPQEIHAIAQAHLHHPIIFETKPLVEPDKLNQKYYDIYQQNDKFSLLLHLLQDTNHDLAIVFCGTRTETDIVARNLRNHGIKASAIHGGMSQQKRMKSLERLKTQKIDVLVATDVAARGLDIKNVSHVYNYDVPKTSQEYIHRIGRTARAGENGDAITLLTSRDHENFRRVQSNEKLIIKKARFPQFKKVRFFRQHTKRKRQYR